MKYLRDHKICSVYTLILTFFLAVCNPFFAILCEKMHVNV